MKYKEFEEKIKDWGEKYNYKPIIKIDSEYIVLNNNDYIISMIYKLERFVLDFNWVAYRHFSENARRDLFKIITEFAATPIEEREDKKDNLDLIINRLKEIETNVEDVIGWKTAVSWSDVMDWMIKEIENRDLINSLGDIIIDLEEYKEANER